MSTARVIVAVLVIAIAAAGLYYGFRAGEEPAAPQGGKTSYTVRAATLQGGISTLDVIEAEGLLEARGYGLEVLRLQKTPNILEALARNDTDLAVIPAEMAAKLVQDGQDIVIVAVDMLQNQAILVYGNSTPASPADLEGKLVGAFLPSGTYKLFKAYMKIVYNLTVVEGEEPQPGVVTAVNVPPGSILDALQRRQVDAVVIWEPFVSLGLSKGMRILANFSDLWSEAGAQGEPVMLVWVARGDFARSHEDALRAFLSARSEAAKMWAENREIVIDILTNLYKMPEPAADTLYGRTVIVQGNLTDALIDSIRSEWWLAWKGGYLAQDPAGIPDTVFYRP